MTRRTIRLFTAAWLAAAVGAGLRAGVTSPIHAAPNARTAHRLVATGKLSQCRVPGLEEDILCGQLEVYENRGTRAGRRIPLKIVVLPATGSAVEPDPVAFLAGGGVLPATRYAARFARAFAPLRRNRDILLVDQRGTGGSNRLGCAIAQDALPAHRHPEAYDREIRRCRAELETRADLRLYTTPIAMDDLDEVREWLGYPRVNLFGVSYGTKAAQVYLRQHPDRVRTVVFHGPMPVDVAMWPDLPVNASLMLDRVLGACEADTDCRTAFPRVRQELDMVLGRLRQAPVDVPVVTVDGQTKQYRLDETEMRKMAGGASVSRIGMADFPLFVHAAAGGNFGPIGQIASEEAPSDMTPPKGLFLSILCAETIPLADPVAYKRSAAASIYGEWAAEMPLRECGQWVRASLPPDFWKPVVSSVPALIMAGEFDAVTPVAYAERLLPRFERGALVTLPWRGHNDADPCVFDVAQAFMAAGTKDGLDTSCVETSPPLKFRTALRPGEERR